ncbi:uncharacterized protein LOC131023283 [Salvia miltiorrhiza]|uniref:uncharacterized protein LOC131023283 n=1 Tax=Salvia miltiorrhiza TaxID=226208 RepID=UPI0025AD220F|nr:uncharacterized protein LOC131023283 [Salvia miltiorrhiza]
MEIGKDKIKVSHLQYADDTIFLLEDSDGNIEAVKWLLKLFHFLSGLTVNFKKCSLIGIMVDGDKLTRMAAELNCKVDCCPFSYLGQIIGGGNNKVADWQFLEEKIKRRIESWKNQKLALEGRITLVKAVLQAIPVFHLSFALIPKTTVHSINSLCGGGNLWAKIIRSVYGDVVWGSEGLEIRGNQRSKSSWWGKIVEGGRGVTTKWFENNLVKSIGNGRETLFWEHRWVGNQPLKIRFPRLYFISSQKGNSISDMGSWEDDVWAWNLKWNRELFQRESGRVNELISVISSISPHAGRILEANAMRSAKAWKISAPQKAKVTMWRSFRNRLPTCDNLKKRRIPLEEAESMCNACCYREETVQHLFLLCPKTEMIWNGIQKWLGVHSVRPNNIEAHFDSFTNLGKGKQSRKFLEALWVCIIWLVWKSRNESRFGGKNWEVTKMMGEIKARIWSWNKSFGLADLGTDFVSWFSDFSHFLV